MPPEVGLCLVSRFDVDSVARLIPDTRVPVDALHRSQFETGGKPYRGLGSTFREFVSCMARTPPGPS